MNISTTNKSSGRLITILWTVLFIGGAVLLYKMPALTIPILILLPCLTYYLSLSKNKAKTTGNMLIPLLLTIFMMLINWTSVFEFSIKPFVDGKVVEKQVVVESENGNFEWITKRAFVADTKKGENTMKVIEQGLGILIALSFLITVGIFKASSKNSK